MKKYIVSVLTAIMLLVGINSAHAVEVDVTFEWTASVSADVVGYKLYVKEDGFFKNWYTNWEEDMDGYICDTSNTCQVTLTIDLPYGDYVFGAKAYNAENMLSDMSDETEVWTLEEAPVEPPPVIKPQPPTNFRTFLQKVIAFFKRFSRNWRSFRS